MSNDNGFLRCTACDSKFNAKYDEQTKEFETLCPSCLVVVNDALDTHGIEEKEYTANADERDVSVTDSLYDLDEYCSDY